MTRRLSLLIPAVLLLAPQTVLAQLDPLLFLKRTESNVLILMDTSERMQRDGDEAYYDPNIYQKKNKDWEAAIGINATNTNQYYRRTYVWLLHKNSSEKFEANRIVAVGDLDSGYATFEARTRLSVARTALITAVKQNLRSVRWGLVRTRQSSPQVGAEGSSSVKIVDDDAQEAASDSSSGASGIWQLTRGTVAGLNGANTVVTAPLVSPTAADQNARVLEILPKNVRQAGALIPAGGDQYGVVDAPIDYLLEDARIEAQKLVVDPECRNTAVILVTGGSEGNSVAGANPVGTAAKFLDVLGRRVPIYVIAVVPHPGDIAQLKAIAAASGGVYTEITKAMIEAVAAGTAVPEIVRAVNAAVQKTFVDSTTFSVAPSVTQPLGPGQEFQVTSPIVGTANLENATDITGTALENSVIFHPVTDTKIPQRSNLMVTTGFELPGFLGRLRGFRVYKPVEDETKPSGYKFVQAGTRLWVASVPEAASRNIHTTLPDGTMIAFDETNAAVLATYLRTSVADAPALINFIRSQPLGAIVGSTPAIMDPPSLDPPPDSEYPAFVEANKDRRSVVWVGANDGMLHGFDARLGVEVWAYIPFNLLPKLRLLALGQPIDRFSYFVDSSPKVADVKVAGKWRTYLVIGEGPGGTFYQTFDVTLPKIADAVAPASDNLSDVLAYFKSPDQVPLKWSFPRLSSFDHSFGQWGDLKDSASAAELTVGETWSDPAIGQIESGLGPHTVLVASGFLKYSVQQQANRKGMVAGNSFYLLDAETGNMLASQSVGSDGKAEKVDDCRWPTVTINDNDPTTNSGDENTISGGKADAKANCEQIKNALQADPVATGPVDSR